MKAQDYVNEGMSTVECAMSSLKSAMTHAEKQANKQVIQKAMDEMQSACDCLKQFQD